MTRTPGRAPRLRTPTAARQFTVLLSPTRRGARLARLLTVAQLASWELPSETAAQLVSELASNAVLHGHVKGRSFRLTVRVTEGPSGRSARTALRIEVTDARPERLPSTRPAPSPPEAESGRGLLLVEALADRWGVTPGPAPCKTVWAETNLTVRTSADLR
ncbi:ATP-binding protein [Streptomyces sp. HNM0575]|nr:ATP-binding protein [Streptomyces sp. HNM0575]